MNIKKYKVLFNPMVRWAYNIKDPFNPHNLDNMSEIIFVSDFSTQERIIEAPNKEVAKGMLAIKLYEENLGKPAIGRTIAMNAINNIKSIEQI